MQHVRKSQNPFWLYAQPAAALLPPESCVLHDRFAPGLSSSPACGSAGGTHSGARGLPRPCYRVAPVGTALSLVIAFLGHPSHRASPLREEDWPLLHPSLKSSLHCWGLPELLGRRWEWDRAAWKPPYL